MRVSKLKEKKKILRSPVFSSSPRQVAQPCACNGIKRRPQLAPPKKKITCVGCCCTFYFYFLSILPFSSLSLSLSLFSIFSVCLDFVQCVSGSQTIRLDNLIARCFSLSLLLVFVFLYVCSSGVLCMLIISLHPISNHLFCLILSSHVIPPVLFSN